MTARGFITVDPQRRTTVPHIYAIGDVAGDPMLAHKATYDAKIAVEHIAGHKVAFEPAAIPAVVFTDPELAWCGLTEAEAQERGIKVEVAKFPWGASGRATTVDRNDGLTKLIIEPGTERVLGVGIVGVNAGELIAEGVLAVEMAATASDLKMTIHAHPTLGETVMESAEVLLRYGHELLQAEEAGVGKYRVPGPHRRSTGDRSAVTGYTNSRTARPKAGKVLAAPARPRATSRTATSSPYTPSRWTACHSTPRRQGRWSATT